MGWDTRKTYEAPGYASRLINLLLAYPDLRWLRCNLWSLSAWIFRKQGFQWWWDI